MKHVLISRQWHAPEISIEVTDHGIGVSMPLDDFIAAVVTQAGNPTVLVTKAQLLRRLQKAAEQVAEGMKAETSKVM